jgi:electron-transferring-flavoprotein dehydrogenase
MKCGMLAADHLAETGAAEGFDAKLRDSEIVRELHRVRNIRPAFYKGFWRGFIRAAIETVTLGKLPLTTAVHADDSALKKVDEYSASERHWVERDLPPRDRLASVYFATTEHDEDQPVHLQIIDPEVCTTRCVTEYNNPCTRFCPAQVYEMTGEGDQMALQINAANCVHCKTCDIKDPYQVINWVTPEGGCGPMYQNM